MRILLISIVAILAIGVQADAQGNIMQRLGNSVKNAESAINKVGCAVDKAAV